MSDERQAETSNRGADESMYVHSKQRRNLQSRPFHESAAFSLLPPRPRSYRDTQLSSRGSEPLGLQVQGFCCPLQQRPSSGRVTPQSRGGGDGRLILLSSLKGSLENRAKPESGTRTGNRPVMTPQGGGTTVSRHRDRASETAETPATPCNNERQAVQGQAGATQVSELHLYLPSSVCEDQDQDSETEEMRYKFSAAAFVGVDAVANHRRADICISVMNCSLGLQQGGRVVKQLMWKQITQVLQHFPTQHPVVHSRPRSPSDDITPEDSEQLS